MINLFSLRSSLKTAFSLGPINILRYFYYKIRIRFKITVNPKFVVNGNFFEVPGTVPYNEDKLLASHEGIRILLFGWNEKVFDHSPKWEQDYLSGQNDQYPNRYWTKAQSLNHNFDPKLIWELNRLYWVPDLAFQVAKGDLAKLDILNIWLNDWVKKNTPYCGIVWSCGQEASIRILNLSFALILLKSQKQPTEPFKNLVRLLLDRVLPTYCYALAQQNNHASTESCALMVAGTLLENDLPYQLRHIYKKGKKNLERLILLLIYEDGSPSQHSINYHRANLEIFSMAELWRRSLNLPSFSNAYYERLSKGNRWLYEVTDVTSGQVPNFGANDGSHLFRLPGDQYHDYRPTIAFVAALIDAQRAYSESESLMERASYFSLKTNGKVWTQKRKFHDTSGGYFVIRTSNIFCLMSYPKNKSRPIQADALNVDLWFNGTNVLKDSGSYSYGSESSVNLESTAAHNTVEFDGRDQMPKIRKFLYSNWVNATDIEDIKEDGQWVSASARYVDYCGASHCRKIKISDKVFECHDIISGNFNSAKVHYKLPHLVYHLEDFKASCELFELSVQSSSSTVKFYMHESQVASHYMKMEPTKSAVIQVNEPSTIITRIAFE